MCAVMLCSDLLQGGALVDAVAPREGDTPLHLAALGRHADVVEVCVCVCARAVLKVLCVCVCERERERERKRKRKRKRDREKVRECVCVCVCVCVQLLYIDQHYIEYTKR